MTVRRRALWAALAILCAACGQAEAPVPAAAQSAASPSIIAAFRKPHPLEEAQALEAQGRHDEAVARARAAIAADPAIADLCFDRFTVGGAEIVLRPCAQMPGEAGNVFVRERAQRLALLPDVAYAEPNLIAER